MYKRITSYNWQYVPIKQIHILINLNRQLMTKIVYANNWTSGPLKIWPLVLSILLRGLSAQYPEKTRVFPGSRIFAFSSRLRCCYRNEFICRWSNSVGDFLSFGTYAQNPKKTADFPDPWSGLCRE